MGTPELAAAALAALHGAGYGIPLVVTQPDRPHGRGNRIVYSPVKAYALEHGLSVFQPTSLRAADTIRQVQEVEPDVIVVAAYGRILPPALLEAAPLGCLNIHPSLLPAYRGPAPIQWTLLNGETESGVTIMQMDEGMDTGPILAVRRMAIPDGIDFGALYDDMAETGAALLLETLPLWADGRLPQTAQPEIGVSYAPQVAREDEIVDWSQSASRIRDQVRAFSPSPGASTAFGGHEIKILDARVLTEGEAGQQIGEPVPGRVAGRIRGQGPIVETGEGYLLITRVCPAGRKPMDAWAWMNGSRLENGQLLGA